jgi:hypothetical protein
MSVYCIDKDLYEELNLGIVIFTGNYKEELEEEWKKFISTCSHVVQEQIEDKGIKFNSMLFYPQLTESFLFLCDVYDVYREHIVLNFIRYDFDLTTNSYLMGNFFRISSSKIKDFFNEVSVVLPQE